VIFHREISSSISFAPYPDFLILIVHDEVKKKHVIDGKMIIHLPILHDPYCSYSLEIQTIFHVIFLDFTQHLLPSIIPYG
jgi:hypothetical protein